MLVLVQGCTATGQEEMASSCIRRDSGLTLGKNFFIEIGMTLERPAQASGGAPIPGSVQEMTTQGTLCYSSVDMMLFSQRLVFISIAFWYELS